MREKSLATAGLMPNARVITGKATAPPPSDVIPPTAAPKIIVKVRAYLSGKRAKKSCFMARHHQASWNSENGMNTPIRRLWPMSSFLCQGASWDRPLIASRWDLFSFWPLKIKQIVSLDLWNTGAWNLLNLLESTSWKKPLKFRELWNIFSWRLPLSQLDLAQESEKFLLIDKSLKARKYKNLKI